MSPMALVAVLFEKGYAVHDDARVVCCRLGGHPFVASGPLQTGLPDTPVRSTDASTLRERLNRKGGVGDRLGPRTGMAILGAE